MKNRILLLLLASVNLIFSQMEAGGLYIGDNTYIFVKNNVLTSTKNIRMETATSNIYLRDNAQLYQIDDIKNLDAGELSVYQEQTTGIYEYNYWCSPVGVSSDGTVQANVNFIGADIMHDPADDTDPSNVTSSVQGFTSAYDATATELSSFWMYTYISGEGFYAWNKILNTGQLAPGYGFTLKGSPNTNNTIDFRGRPNNGTITVDCSFDGVDNEPDTGKLNYAETLTGNPYPSALDLKLFFANSVNNQNDLDGIIYFWEQKAGTSHNMSAYEGGYGYYIPGPLGDLGYDGTYTESPFVNYNNDGTTNTTTSGNTSDFALNHNRRYAAIGQGFVVSGNVNGGNIEFNNSMRVYLPEDSSTGGDGSIFYKNTNEIKTEKVNIPLANNGIDYKSLYQTPTTVPEIRIHTFINNTFYKENVIAFRESTPNNYTYNKFYDGLNTYGLSDDAYLMSENIELSIKSINYSEDTTIPFGVKFTALNPSISVKVNRLINVPEGVKVYLYDNETDTYTDIINNSFDLFLEPGVYNNRFNIAFKDNNTLSNNQNTFENVKIFQNNALSQLNITIPNNLNIINFNLYDATGKQIVTDHSLSRKKQASYTTKSFSEGIYIVKLTNDNNETFTKKVIISNAR